MIRNNLFRTSTALAMIGVLLVSSVAVGLVVAAPQAKQTTEESSAPVVINQDNETANETTTEGAATTTETGANLTELDNQTDLAANITFENQTTNGSAVVVSTVNLSQGGFVVIHQLGNVTAEPGGNLSNSSAAQAAAQNVTSPAQPVPGDIIGVSEYLPPGTHENVTVRLFTDVPGQNFTQDALQNDQTLIAMLYRDFNGNESFDVITSNATEDGPFLVNGTGVLDSATVKVTGNATTETETTIGGEETTESETTTTNAAANRR